MANVITEKKWELNPTSDSERIAKLSKELNGVHPVICDILIQRGIDDLEKAQAFFRPKRDDLNDPFLMKDMDRAVKRILEAKEENQKIMVLGDYDVDGTTSAAMTYLFLQSLDIKSDYYIPDRYIEGYGISTQSIDEAVAGEFDLMICLDCGIKALDKVDYANKNGIDMIICDHHTPGDRIPDAFAVLDPKRSDCNYPFKELSGCGVGFKLVQAVLEKLNLPKDKAFQYLDLLATSIAADIVPITGENRVMASFGVEKVNSDPLIGIRALKELVGHKNAYNTSDLVFKLAPRINAAGRMASGKKAVEILVSQSFEKAMEVAGEINIFNQDRGETDKKITQEALSIIESDDQFSKRKSTVLYHSSWHKGVIGIVASRMIESYYRPTIIFSGDGDVLSGSARSVSKFNIYDAIEACEEHLIQFGGHKYAAGMTLKKEKLEDFKNCFERVVSSTITEESLIPTIRIDSALRLGEINRDLFKVLKRMAPFGPGNMNPVFQAKNVLVSRTFRVGKEKSHLKLQLFDPDHGQNELPAIAFGFGHLADEIDDGVPVDVAYSIEENIWNGYVELQLNIKDIKISAS